MNTSIYNTKMLIVESYRNVFINAIADIPHHKFLKSNRFKLHLLFICLLLWNKLFRSSMSKQIRKHEFYFQNHFSLIEACLLILILIWLRKQLLICYWLICINFYSEVPTIIYFYLFLTKSNHECSWIILHVNFVNWCRQDIMMIEILFLFFTWILWRRNLVICALPLSSLRINKLLILFSLRWILFWNCIRLRVIKLFSFLVIHASP